MSLTPQNLPQKSSQGQPPGQRPLPANAGDLLLVLIINLLALRFLQPFIQGIFLTDSPLEEPSSDVFLQVLLTVFVVQSLVLIVAIDFIIRRKYGLTWADLGLRPLRPGWLQRSIIFGILSVPLMTIMLLVSQGFIDETFENPQMELFSQLPPTWFSAISVILAASILVPIAEELAFRGILFPWLRDRLGLSPAIFLSGLLFGLVHSIPELIPALTVFGMLLAAITHHSGTIWSAIIVHGIFNGIQLSMHFKSLMDGFLPGQV